MCRLDVVGSFCLLDCQPVVCSVSAVHQPDASARLRVVVVATRKVCLAATAAIRAYRPKVVGHRRGRSKDDWGHAKKLPILEAHGLLHIQLAARSKLHNARIQKLLSQHAVGIHHRVVVQVAKVVISRGGGEILVALVKAHDPCQEKSQGKENPPRRLPFWCDPSKDAEAARHRLDQNDDHNHQQHKDRDVAQDGLAVVDLEGQQAIDQNEEPPGHQGAHNEWHKVHLSLGQWKPHSFAEGL
mmetsp:Transcript_53854/g.117871  ORF Transcript_53854/g.117871 Transcript_53854/m.117871 type:complete len:242 (-) Transcript_53854:176-901(-)